VNDDLAFWIRADLEVPVFTGDEVRAVAGDDAAPARITIIDPAVREFAGN